MTADHAPHQTCVAKVIEPPFAAVPLSCGVDQREVARLVCRNRLIWFCEIKCLYCQSDFFGEADADKAACCNRVPVPDEAGGFLCGDHLTAIECFDWRKRKSNWIG